MSNLKEFVKIINRVIIVSSVVTLFSCEFDYDPNLKYKPQAVINSIITPDSAIKINLLWTKEFSEISDYKNIENIDAKIYENGILIFEGTDLSAPIHTSLFPKIGATYELEIDIPNYNKITAKTKIPTVLNSNISYLGWKGNKGDLYKIAGYHHFTINSIRTSSEAKAILVRALAKYNDGIYMEFSNSYYTSSQLCDQFNAIIDNYETAIKGSNISYDEYIRIPFKDLERIVPISFSINNFRSSNKDVFAGYDSTGFPIYESVTINPDTVFVQVINPSDEYDKYLKSVYEQIVLGDISPEVFNMIVPVDSNIEGGLGIFAGYSSCSFKIKLEEHE